MRVESLPTPIMYYIVGDKGESLTYITLGFQNTSTHIYQLVFTTTLQDIISMLEMKKHNWELLKASEQRQERWECRRPVGSPVQLNLQSTKQCACNRECGQ